MKKALITGITGQDGSYLAELLVADGYEVLGTTSGGSDRRNLEKIAGSISIIEGDIAEEAVVRELIAKHTPDEVYNLASVATVAKPWEDVGTIARATALAPLYFLEAIRQLTPKTRFFQASSAEMFGVVSGAQNESAVLNPRNPYGVAKIFAHQMVQAYRRDQGLFAVSGILFNHESPRRKTDFVMRRICHSIAAIKCGSLEQFALGNLESRRDWGYAGDYVRAMHLSLLAEKADDYVIASGALRSVREIVEVASAQMGVPLSWVGTGLDEKGVSDGKVIITIDPSLYRPGGVDAPYGDITKARSVLKWTPEKSFEDLVRLMVRADYESAQKMK